MKIVSFNTRNSNDVNGHSIAERAPRIIQVIFAEDADLIGLQEYGVRMKEKIEKSLLEKYEIVEKFTNVNIASPVLWKKERFECVDKGWFWLSDTPDVASASWDDYYKEERVCTWVKLREKQTDKCFVYMNTHLGIGTECLRLSPVLINEYCERFAGLPIIVTGDFNMTPEAEGYKAMVKYFTDVNAVTVDDQRPTYHGYNTISEEKKGLIDYCFIKGEIKADDYQTLDITIDGKYPSDHHAIMAKVTLGAGNVSQGGMRHEFDS